MARFQFLALLFLTLISSLSAQEDRWAGFSITCFSADTVVPVLLPAPADFLSGQAVATADFVLDFGEDVPAVAQVALQFAASIWGSRLRSEVPINVRVEWESQDSPNVLASAGPTGLLRNFAGATPNTWYPTALAEAIIGMSVNEDEADIRILVNSDADWYFGIDGLVPGNQLDLATVAIHELGHGLGFLASVDTVQTGDATEVSVGFNNIPIVYDRFVEDVDGNGLTNAAVYPNPSAALLDLVTVEEIFFSGSSAMARFGARPPLFSPGNFDVGSSVSHLCEFEFRPGTEDALMSPQLARREAIHDIGPVILGIMEDLGWTVNFDLTTDTREFGVAAPLTVFPNPATDVVKVTFPFSAEAFEYRITDTRGRVVTHGLLTGDGLISVAGLPDGLYFFTATAEGRMQTGRFWKKR